jgi:hypothetical protein
MQRLGFAHSGVVDQEVDAAPALECRVHDPPRPVVGCQVDCDRGDAFGIPDRGQFGEPGFVAARPEDRHALACELGRATESDAAARPRHDSYLHVSPPSS